MRTCAAMTHGWYEGARACIGACGVQARWPDSAPSKGGRGGPPAVDAVQLPQRGHAVRSFRERRYALLGNGWAD